MSKKCLYCQTGLSDSSVIDFCERCGKGVWGDKMFNTIVKNMEESRERGDLCPMNLLPENKESSGNF